MQVETSQPYTILRIKRKRNEEPLDALVVEDSARRKKSKSPGGMFKFAQTVEDDAWEDIQLQQKIHDEVSRLASAPVLPVVPFVAPTNPPAKGRRISGDFARRYTILAKESEKTTPQMPTNPPQVLPENKQVSQPKKFAMFDAVPEGQGADEMDSDMENIMPLLKAYLSVNEPDLASTVQENDYVWDVFYHRPSLSEWNSAATIGTLTGLPPSLTDPNDSDSESEDEDDADEDSNAEEYYGNDYPEDEDSSDWGTGSSDEFHENSEYDDSD